MASFFAFEVEHVFNQSLWKETNREIAKFLKDNGYLRDAGGNQIALFSAPLLVDKIQSLDPNDPLRKALSDPASNTGSYPGSYRDRCVIPVIDSLPLMR